MKEFRHRDYNPFERKPRDFPYPYILDGLAIRAKCPKCGRITSIRTCQSCKELMCDECLLEHQVTCLHKS